MALTTLGLNGWPACEVEEHQAVVFATHLVPVENGGQTLRWVAVCDHHQGYGDEGGSGPLRTAFKLEWVTLGRVTS